jgi:hypothetical protein
VVYKIIALVAASMALGFLRGLFAAVLPGAVSAALINMAVQIVIDAVIGAFVIYSSILDEDISDFRFALLPRIVATAGVASTWPA